MIHRLAKNFEEQVFYLQNMLKNTKKIENKLTNKMNYNK